MAVGDVTVQIVDVSGGAIDTAMTAMRVTVNDKFMLTNSSNGQQVLIAHIEEA